MATVNAFSVFPPPQPRIPRIAMPNPHIRKPSLRTIEVKESVVIALQEVPVPAIPKEYTSQASLKSPTSTVFTLPSSPVFKNGVPPPPPVPASYSSKKSSMARDGPSSVHSSPEPGSVSSGETLVRSSSDEVPMRSMFPVYNPNVPMSQQAYHPQQPVASYNPQRQPPLSPPLYPPSVFGGSVRGSVVSQSGFAGPNDVPLESLNSHKSLFSSRKDLECLWDAAQDTVQNMTTSSFNLEMSRPEEATFVFSAAKNIPFYTVTTYDTSEIGITKTCPRNSNVKCDVVLSQIEPPSRRAQPNDGLISFIFPKMAAMLAINQSNAFADEFDLAPTDRDEIQSEAIKRAAGQEASNLRWNAAERRYELQHPAIARRKEDINFVSSPLSRGPKNQPVLHITVIAPDSGSQDEPIVLATCPSSVRSQAQNSGSDVASPKSPDQASEMQLASLDYNTKTLHIEAGNILEIMPSQFAIDSIISALVTVSVADDVSNVAMAEMKVSAPKPLTIRANSFNGVPSVVGTPRTGTFYATIAEREEAEEEARAAAKAHRKSAKSVRGWKTSKPPVTPAEQVDVEAGRTWYGKSKAKKQKKKQQIIMGEFDLETLTHYQSGSRQGQKLPGVTRGVLTIMVGSLKFVVWFLTMIVQFLAWILVALTRGVTSEKF